MRGSVAVYLKFLLFLSLSVISAYGQRRVTAVTVDFAVHPITAEIITHAIEEAERQRSAALLVRLNTPGGLMEAMRQIVEKLIASPVPVITYVSPSGGRAASAGFFLLQAGDVAAMANGTHTGAATPVSLGPEMDPVMQRKVENDAAALLRSLTESRGRNSAVAETTILEAKSFTEKEALDQKLIDLIAGDEATLLERLDGREIKRFDGRKEVLRTTGASIVNYERTLREKVIAAIADPNLAFALVSLGSILLYVEFSIPGLIGPGVAGAIMVLLGLMSLSVLPINWAAAGLILLALVLFVLEAKLASYGVLGIGGAVAMVLGAMMLVEGPPEMRIRLGTAVAVSGSFAVITVFLLSLILRAHKQPVETGESGMLLKTGVAYTELSPSGKVFVHGEYWDAVASSPLPQGAPVRVTGIDGLLLTVEPVSQSGIEERKVT